MKPEDAMYGGHAIFLGEMRRYVRVQMHVHFHNHPDGHEGAPDARFAELVRSIARDVDKNIGKKGQSLEEQLETREFLEVIEEHPTAFPGDVRPGTTLFRRLSEAPLERNDFSHALRKKYKGDARPFLETLRDFLLACEQEGAAGEIQEQYISPLRASDAWLFRLRVHRRRVAGVGLAVVAAIVVAVVVVLQLWSGGDPANPGQAATSNPPQTTNGDVDSPQDEPSTGGEEINGGPEQQGGSTSTPIEPPSPAPNSPPECDGIEGFSLVEGEEQQVSVSCSDDDGDTITLRVSAESQTDYHRVSPDTARIDGSGTQSFTIAGRRSSAGAGDVEIEADDGKGGTDMVRFSVVVDADEDEPTGTEPPPVVPPEIEGGISCAPSLVAVNVSVTCEVSLSEGGTPPFTYEWSDSDGGSGGNEDYSTSFRSPGEKTVQLTVRNSANSDSDLTKVTVFNRSPEQVDSIPSLTVGKGWGSDEVELGSYFRDQDGDNLTYTATSSNEDCVRPRVVGHNDDELTITGHCEGSATITVIVSDGNGGETEQIFIARVVPRPSWFVYCLPNTTSIYYLRGAHGTKHQIDITRSQAEGLWGSSFWDEIAIMSSSDCARWPTGSPYDYDDARREVERA